MKSELKSLTIREFIDLKRNDNLELKPDYQRNPIWSRKAQKSLISSILKNWPIPNIVLKKTEEDRQIEVVDGQQRLRAIFAFYNGTLKSEEGDHIDDLASEDSKTIRNRFTEYQIPVTEITSIGADEKIENFYALINRSGLRLNKAEVAKAEYHDTEFISLIQELGDEDSTFSALETFTRASRARMNHLDFIAELLALIKFGPTDKKESVDEIFEQDLSEAEASTLRDRFNFVIGFFAELNEIVPVSKSRLRQKNDFYSFFDIILGNEHEHFSEALKVAYEAIIRLSIYNLIRPSQDQCDILKEYAVNCVTQSNSKAARLRRREILTALFFNHASEPSPEQSEVLEYFKLDESYLKRIGNTWISFKPEALVDPRQPELF